MNPDSRDELLRLNQRLLDAIAEGDWATYQELCDSSLSAIEPESHGLVVEGLPFHKFYFDLGGFGRRAQTTMHAPHVRVMGDVAVVAYVRLVQREKPDGSSPTVAAAETRVWQKQDGRWRHVHFHRTPLPG
jgi:calcium/calmodulin-dependent protein kinase (CaM kinase) II